MEPLSPHFRECPILAGLTDDDLRQLRRRVQFESFPAGSDVLTEGLSYHSLWMLLKGRCNVIKKGPQKWSQLAELNPGNVFGEISFFEGKTHSATVRAVTDADTARLNFDDYERLRQEHPDIAHKIAVNLVRILAQRLRHMDEWTCELVEKDCDEQRHDEWQQFRAKLYAMKEL